MVRSLHSAMSAHRRRHGGGGGEKEVRIWSKSSEHDGGSNSDIGVQRHVNIIPIGPTVQLGIGNFWRCRRLQSWLISNSDQ